MTSNLSGDKTSNSWVVCSWALSYTETTRQALQNCGDILLGASGNQTNWYRWALHTTLATVLPAKRVHFQKFWFESCPWLKLLSYNLTLTCPTFLPSPGSLQTPRYLPPPAGSLWMVRSSVKRKGLAAMYFLYKRFPTATSYNGPSCVNWSL